MGRHPRPASERTGAARSAELRKGRCVMRITVTTEAADGDDPEPEVYNSLGELESMLYSSATEDYMSNVLGRIQAGETSFSLPNGTDLETYRVEE
jgi:hypothetical protein